MKPIIIGLTGVAGSGKDTVGYYLAEQFGFETMALADPLRMGLMAMLGIDESVLNDRQKKEEPIEWLGVSPRRLLQTLGTEWGRDMIRKDLWIRLARRRLEVVLSRWRTIPGVVITDCRFDDEAEMVRGMGGTVIHLQGRGVNVGDHVSEGGVRFVDGDYRVSNDGTINTLWARIDGVLADLQARAA